MTEDLVKTLEGKLEHLLSQLDTANFKKLSLGQLSTSIGIIYDRLQKEKAKQVEQNKLADIPDAELEKMAGGKIVKMPKIDYLKQFKGEYHKPLTKPEDSAVG